MKCQLSKLGHGDCCCICKCRLRVFEHPATQTGWACVGFTFEEGEDIVYVGDFEHGLCELFKVKPVQESA